MVKKIEFDEDIIKMIEKSNNVILYGAGMVTKAILQYVFQNLLDNHIFCIAVSDKRNNPDQVLGVPVCELHELTNYHSSTIIIATLEKNHKEIFDKLISVGFIDIYGITNVCYARIRQLNPEYNLEILQNTENIKKQVNRLPDIMSEIYKLQYKLGQIEACMQYHTRMYQEILLPRQYPAELKNWYKYKTGKELNLLKPTTYNEKIQWIKLYGVTSLMTDLSDKWAVRRWIKEMIGEEYLVPVIGVWSQFDDINFSELPDKFVLKCTHGSGWNMVVSNKDYFDKNDAKKHFDMWMGMNFAYVDGLELQYKDIPPQIMAEEYLENQNGDLYDYKFWCFNGTVEFIMFLSEREEDLKMNNYDRDWNLLPFTYGHENSTRKIEKPKQLDKMIKIAEKLAQGFPHVRVDLYLLNDGSIKFGEMTFTSCSGICPWNEETINYKLGELITCI
ncbi:MAG: ATP-grasp fold amidoligase family protein [Lachnospiraceae bacterium]|nr:ATP-grasp fold amidoligase family protein [Lachnospiraceae bacterium]